MSDSIFIISDASELTERFSIDQVLLYAPGRNEMIPTGSVYAIVEREKARLLDEFRWGLMPFWAKDSVWADSATLLEKRAFRRIMRKQRCVIPCSGFFVNRTEGKKTVQLRFAMRNGCPFGIAGLYDVWRSPSTLEEIRACTLLTTEPNRLVAPFRERMPAIVDDSGIDLWLNPEIRDPVRLGALLRPLEAEKMSVAAIVSPEAKFDFAPAEDETSLIPAELA